MPLETEGVGPSVQSLDERLVPAVFNVWDPEGGSTDGTLAANWSLGRVPIRSGGVVFDPAVSTADCDTFTRLRKRPSKGSPEGTSSIWLMPGYTGTVTPLIGSAFDVNTFKIEGGTVNQQEPIDPDTGLPFKTEITVHESFVWTGGNINPSSANPVSTVRLAVTAVGTIDPTSSVSLGSHISVEDSSQLEFKPGVVNFLKGADLVINPLAKVDMKAMADADIVFSGGAQPGPISIIENRGLLTIKDGVTKTSQVPVWINGGTMKVLNAYAKFDGRVGLNEQAYSVLQTSGTTAIQHGSRLVAVNEMKLTGGLLTTLKNGDGLQPAATIEADVTNSGADITFLTDMIQRKPGAGVRFGTLAITRTLVGPVERSARSFWQTTIPARTSWP